MTYIILLRGRSLASAAFRGIIRVGFLAVMCLLSQSGAQPLPQPCPPPIPLGPAPCPPPTTTNPTPPSLDFCSLNQTTVNNRSSLGS